MNCIVTAGPTFEPLDDVRRLTNFSTGRLGTELANFLVARGHKVILLIGEMSTFPGERMAQKIEPFSTAANLQEKFKLLAAKKTDAIFHAAAVGDFSVGRIFEPNEAGKLSEIKDRKKISTRHGKLLAELLPTPKIISGLRGLFPKSTMVGWKYEAEGQRADAIAAGQKQITDCSTDFCVVNGPAYGGGFALIGKVCAPAHLANPPLLFDMLEKLPRR